jgi:hypothetical protein
MSEKPKNNERVQIIQAVQTPLGFFTLVVLVVEIILGLLASKASGLDFTILLVSMVLLLFSLIIIVGIIVNRNPAMLTGPTKQESGETPSDRSKTVDDTAAYLNELISQPIIKSITNEARTNSADHLRIASAHTVWSCHPDLARSILEDARDDLAEVVRDHAKALLRRFYRQSESLGRDTNATAFLSELLSQSVLKLIINDARKHSSDNIRIACAHTIWSCRPDLAKAILVDASDDLSEEVRDHAKALLRKFY